MMHLPRFLQITRVAALLVCTTALPNIAEAVVWSTVRDNVITNNGVVNCTECHSVTKTDSTFNSSAVASRHSAPVGINFDSNPVNDLTSYNNATSAATFASADPGYGFTDTTADATDNAIDRIYERATHYLNSTTFGTGYMPMDPINGADFTDATNLSTTRQNYMRDWALQGAPYAAATANTDTNQTSKTKTSIVVQGDFDTNVHSGTAVAGTYYFEYGETTSYGSNTTIQTRSSTSTLSNTTATISGLECGTLYHYRAVATNGHSGGTDQNSVVNGTPATGTDRTFTTSSCTDPVIAGGNISGSATSEAASEGVNNNYPLTVTDDDPGSLQWSKTNGSNGTVTLVSATSTAFSGSATARYTPSGDFFGIDTFTVTVTNQNTSTSHTVTFTVTVADDGTDSPVITASSPLSLNEDNSASANATTSAASVSISAFDPDNSPNYFWDVSTAAVDGTANFSVATGASPTLTYTPLQNDFGTGTDSFNVRVCDTGVGTGNCDTQVFSVNLTARADDPVAVADPSMTIAQGDTIGTDLDVIANDTDVDNPGNSNTGLIIKPGSITTPSSTNFTVAGIFNNRIRVTHNGLATPTSATLQYITQDAQGNDSGLATVTVTLTGVNNPPTANSTSQNVDEGTSFVFDLAGSATYSSDPEMDALTVSSLTCTSCPNASVQVISGGPDDGKVRYTHDGTDVTGGEMDTFTFEVDDSNVGNGPSNTGTITVNLQHVNDEPVPVADSFSVDEGASFTSTVDNFDQGPGNDSVLDNDTDEENGTGTGFTVVSNSTPADNTSFSINAAGEVSYIHDGSENASTSFTYVLNDGTDDSLSGGTVTITINPINDQPVITSTAPSSATLTLTEEVAVSNIYQLTQTDDDDNSFTYSLGATGLSGDTGAGDMAISAAGLVSWTPPRTGVFNNATAMVTVTVSDENDSSGSNGIQSAVQMFNLATSPLDTDSDGVADYSDNCPGISNAGQEDLDNDTMYTAVDPSGIPATGDVDPGAADANGFATGGDACDADVDGDGIPKVFEDSVAYLSDTDAADALLDEDGDGVSNLQEFRDGTDPAVDTVGPTVTAPADVTVDATGYLTIVEVGQASVVDGNDGAVFSVVPAVDANPPIDTATMGCEVLDDYPADVQPFRPGRHTITWISCDSSDNLAKSTDQIVIVKPLVSVTSGQNVGEGQAAVIEAVLNGAAASYPVTVNYTVAGLSDPATDHDASDGVITITDPDVDGISPGVTGELTVNIIDDMTAESLETVIIDLVSSNHAAISTSDRHTISIVADNVAPEVGISVMQGTEDMGSLIYISDNGIGSLTGNVVLTADDFDANGDMLSYIWTDGGIATGSTTTGTLTIDPTTLSAGVYPVSVEVSDGLLTTTASIELVAVAVAPTLAGGDADMDGATDAIEGPGDDDGDGIPNYLDDDSLPENVLQNQTANAQTSTFLETDLGLTIGLGTTAKVADRMGAVVSQTDIENFGGSAGSAGLNPDDDYDYPGGLFDFEIAGLNDSTLTANVVIPLPIAMLPDAQYRKYDGTGWTPFVVDNLNFVSSAPGEPGVCPAPGSTEYTQGLTVFHYCVQLTIEDGGPNDTDGVRNFVIRDPGGVGLPATAATTTTAAASDRLGMIGPLLLILLLPYAVVVSRRRHRD